MSAVLHRSRFLMAETAHERLPPSEVEVAFVGRSNVGKSSLLCALTNNWKLARVSKTPGATRAINIYETRPGRWLVDLPGYGFAVGPKRQSGYWPEMIGNYLAERSALKRVYVLIDAEIGAGKIDFSMVNWLDEQGVPLRLVATKIDKFGRQKHPAQRNSIAAALGRLPDEVFWVSAKKSFGLPALQQDVLKELGI